MNAAEHWQELYSAHDRERFCPEPVKRVDAPERTPFERDRARLLHSAGLRRLAAKTQVMGPDTDDFVRNRLTHSLEVAQIARDLAHPLGCHPDLAETAALAHDLGHPPFGHNGERVLDELGATAGGFEGNAQTLRLLTRLEAKSFGPDGRSLGLNLTRATLDACTKYPWLRSERHPAKFGVYADDREVFEWMRSGVSGERRPVEAQVMDVADDVAYSVHDFEDGIVGGWFDPRVLASADERAAVLGTLRAWYLPELSEDAFGEAWQSLSMVAGWPLEAYDGSRSALRGLKNFTSDVIGIFCGAIQRATQAQHGDQPLVRHQADLVVPVATWHQIGVLKGIAAHYVMESAQRQALMSRQRELLSELFAALVDHPERLDRQHRADHDACADDQQRLRVVLDQIASLTDASAVRWHDILLP